MHTHTHDHNLKSSIEKTKEKTKAFSSCDVIQLTLMLKPFEWFKIDDFVYYI